MNKGSPRIPAFILLALLVLSVRAAAAESEIHFGVLGLFHPKQLVLEPIGNQALSINPSGDDAASALILNGEPGKRKLVFLAGMNSVVVNGQSKLNWTVSARDGSSVSFALSVPGKLRRIYRGHLTVDLRNGELVAVVVTDLETAVASIVAAEMNERAPIEALKAQAVVTRSFLRAGARHLDFDFCDTTHCQFLKSPPAPGSRVWSAVRATQGWVIAFQGKPLAAMYSSRCGGRTRTLRDVGYRSGADDPAAYPYYAVECLWCRKHPLEWLRYFSSEQKPPATGNERQRIGTDRQWGWSALPGNDFRMQQENGGWLVAGRNLGHGVGLCQYGAIGMAAEGASFRAILAHYFPNTASMKIS